MRYFRFAFNLVLCLSPVRAAKCNADNCARVATGTHGGLQSQRLAACSSFQQCTVVPASGASPATTSCPSSVPAFASTCSGASRYASACSCAGITQSFVTASATSTPTTVTSASSLSSTSPSTSTSTPSSASFTTVVTPTSTSGIASATATCPVTTTTSVTETTTATETNFVTLPCVQLCPLPPTDPPIVVTIPIGITETTTEISTTTETSTAPCTSVLTDCATTITAAPSVATSTVTVTEPTTITDFSTVTDITTVTDVTTLTVTATPPAVTTPAVTPPSPAPTIVSLQAVGGTYDGRFVGSDFFYGDDGYMTTYFNLGGSDVNGAAGFRLAAGRLNRFGYPAAVPSDQTAADNVDGSPVVVPDTSAPEADFTTLNCDAVPDPTAPAASYALRCALPGSAPALLSLCQPRTLGFPPEGRQQDIYLRISTVVPAGCEAVILRLIDRS